MGNGVHAMKNLIRSLFFGLSMICLRAAPSGWVYAEDRVQNPKTFMEQLPGEVSANRNAAPGPASESQVRVGAGDLLGVTVFDTPEMTQTIRVNELGDASFNLIGRLHVSDLTPDEARDAITHKLVDGHFLVN